MQQVNHLLDNPEKTLCDGSSAKREKNSPSPRQRKLVTAMWERMSQIFGHKWASQEGEIREANGQYASRFLLWCRKTAHLTDEQWARGFRTLEQRVREAGRQGDVIWPPSYAAFLGFCEEAPKARGHRYFDRSTALEDKTERERRIEIGRRECKSILSMFDN